MAISEVQIARMALSNIGSNSRIEAIGENSAAGKEAELWFDVTRDQVLQAFDWTFARKRLLLALHGDAAPEDEWAFRYQYPSDCVAARKLVNPLGPDADVIPFETSLSDDGTMSILTDLEDACLIYTARVTNTVLWPPMFVQAVGRLLGAHMAFALTGQRAILSDQMEAYNSIMRLAPVHDANQAGPRDAREAEWVRER